jgi:hypothetical protein
MDREGVPEKDLSCIPGFVLVRLIAFTFHLTRHQSQAFPVFLWLKVYRNEKLLQGPIASFIIGRRSLLNILRFYFTSYSIVSSGRGMIPHFQPKAGDLLSLPEMSCDFLNRHSEA